MGRGRVSLRRRRGMLWPGLGEPFSFSFYGTVFFGMGIGIGLGVQREEGMKGGVRLEER